jgi:hypothetical protein
MTTKLRIETAGGALLALLVSLGVLTDVGTAEARMRGRTRFCTATANLQYRACRNEARDDHLTAQAICVNVGNEGDREECFDEALQERRETEGLCGEQRAARRELCEWLGEDRYEPDFDPASYDHDFQNLTNPNPWYPLAIGNRKVFESEDETTTIEVMDKTKLIEGVTCVVVNDVVSVDGVPREDTDDWLAQRKDGTIDYCGESVQDFETFEGDDPMEPELVSREGSFKVGRDGDKPGTLFPGAPGVGQAFRQEWSAGNAEDAAVVISTTYGYGTDPELDAFVPQELAELLCPNHDCVVLAEFTPLDPGVIERKYFAPGIGGFLEVKPDEGEISQLVDCNFDARCSALPMP